MRFSFYSTAIWLATLFVQTEALFTLSPFPTVIQVGTTYTLSWSATLNYTYTLWLVRESPGGNEFAWTKVTGLATGLRFKSLNGSHDWTVPSNLSATANYALWLNGFNIPFNGGSYFDQTEYFKITTSNVPTTSGSTVVRPSATHSGTTSGSTSAASSGASHKSLSGGAIAGIVIGCILAVALIVGAALLCIRYKRHSGVKKREAAARADRLSSVMQKSSPSYEMHGRTQEVVKETNV